MFRISTVVIMMSLAAALANADELPGVLLSRQLIEARGLAPGDVVRLSAAPDGSDAREFRLISAYEPTPDPFQLTALRYEARLHLGDLLGMIRDPRDPQQVEAVDRVNLKLADPSEGDALSGRLVAEIPGLVALPTDKAIVDPNPFIVLERFHQAVALVTVLGSTAFLLSLMIIRSEERRETAGILRLIGFSRPRILVEVFFEGILVATAGAIVGVLLAVVLEDLFNVFFQWRYDTPLVFVRVTPGIAWRCVALALPLGLLAGLAASWALVRKEIMELLHR